MRWTIYIRLKGFIERFRYYQLIVSLKFSSFPIQWVKEKM